MIKFQRQLNYLERLIVNQLAGAKTETLEANGKICRFAVSSTAVKRILPEPTCPGIRSNKNIGENARRAALAEF